MAASPCLCLLNKINEEKLFFVTGKWKNVIPVTKNLEDFSLRPVSSGECVDINNYIG